MRLRAHKVLGISILLLLMTVSAAWGASVELVQDRVFTPTRVGSVLQVELADLTGDGMPEVGILGSSGLEIFSISEDSVMLIIPKADSESFWRFAMGDLTGDSRPDIAVISGHTPSDYLPQEYDIIRLYDGIDFSLSAVDTLIRDSTLPEWVFLEVTAFDVVDLDNDSTNELLVSLNMPSLQPAPFINDGVSQSLLYERFPDSIAWIRNDAVTEVKQFDDPDYGLLIFGSRPWSFYFSMTSFEDAGDGADVVHLRTDGTLEAGISMDEGFQCPVGIPLKTYSESYNYVGDIGAMVPGSDRPNLAIWYWWFEGCGEYTSHDASTGGRGIAMFDITSPSSLTLRWNVDDPALRGPILYHPLFPGFFFAQSASMLCMFRGSDGAELTCTPLPPSKYQWSKSFADGPRLVAHTDSTITIYHLDISTDVTNHSSTTLPTSFSLGAPYPNPFNGSIVLPVSNDHRQHVRIDIINMLGQRIATVFDEELGAGEKSITWNAGDISSGVYFIRATTDSGGDSKKVIYLK